MKTKLLILIFLSILVNGNILAQWVTKLNSGSPNFYGTNFVNETTGWVVGQNGAIRKTTNGGNNWTDISIVSGFFFNVFFTNANTGWVVGQSGVQKTTNGGTSWGSVNNVYSTGLSFPNSNTGYICGLNGYIAKSTNGGINWTSQTSGTTRQLNSIYFADANTGYACGELGTTLKTTDGGAVWNLGSTSFPQTLWSINFIDANTGTAVGNFGRVITTVNGGTNWTFQSSGTTSDLQCVSLRPGTSLGWIVGYNGIILFTSNGGSNWSQQTSPVVQDFLGVHFPANATGFACGTGGVVVATTNGGILLNSPSSLSAAAVSPSQINLSWTDNSTGETVFKIERSLNGVFWSLIDSVGANTTVYSNTGLFSDTRYYYRVFARSPFGVSGNSNEVNTYTMLIAPFLISPANGAINVSVTPTLSWGQQGSASNYHVQISLNDANFNSGNIIFNDSQIVPTSVTIPSGYLGETQNYYWRVRSMKPTSSSLFTSGFHFITMQYPGPNPCEDFSNQSFPPSTFFGEYSGQFYWIRGQQSAYNAGSGAAVFNSWNAPDGLSQNLTTYAINPVGSLTYLTFDHAYRPYITGVDSLIVMASTNGGGSYTTLASMWGGNGAQAGPLNTVFTSGGQFTPVGSQWASKIFQLPVGTNRIRFKGVSGYGNDIWLDNICIQVLPPPASVSIALVPQGFYRTPPPHAISDTVRIYLRRTDFPSISVDSSISVLQTSGAVTSPFLNAINGNYYLVIKHRNSIDTWSKPGGENYLRASLFAYSFLHDSTSAYESNVFRIDNFPFYGLYGGDINRDKNVDLTDLSMIDNAVYQLKSGYVIEDLTGDNFVDISDYAIADNNSFNYVTVKAPPGSESLFNNSQQNDLQKKSKRK